MNNQDRGQQLQQPFYTWYLFKPRLRFDSIVISTMCMLHIFVLYRLRRKYYMVKKVYLLSRLVKHLGL